MYILMVVKGLWVTT